MMAKKEFLLHFLYVDSAVTAALLKEYGHDVTGVYVKTWEHENDILGECPGAVDLRMQDLFLKSSR